MGESARAGFVDAQYALALFYWAGRAVKRDVRQARDWASRAAARGSVPALLLLSRLCEESQTPDATGAYAFVLRALEAAEEPKVREEAQLRERELAVKLSESTVRAAHMLCQDCPETAALIEALCRR